MVVMSGVRPTAAPILVAFEAPARQRRFTVAGRLLLVLPHLVALVIAAPTVVLIVAVGWCWALVVGRLPRFAAVILAGYLSWQTRVSRLSPAPHRRVPAVLPGRCRLSRPGHGSTGPAQPLERSAPDCLGPARSGRRQHGHPRTGHHRPPGGLGGRRRQRTSAPFAPPGFRRLRPLRDPTGRLPDHGDIGVPLGAPR